MHKARHSGRTRFWKIAGRDCARLGPEGQPQPAAVGGRRLRLLGESGVALVEFAFVAPLLFLLLFGMLEMGKAFNYWNDATHLANEGARWAVVNRVPSGGSLQRYIQQQADTTELRNGGGGEVPSPAKVCIEFPTGSTEIGEPVKVSVSFNYKWLPILGLGATTSTLAATSTMRLEQTPTAYGAGCSA